MGVFLVNQITQITEPRGVQTAIRPYHPFIFIMKLKQKITIQTTKQSSTEKKNDENTSLRQHIPRFVSGTSRGSRSFRSH